MMTPVQSLRATALAALLASLVGCAANQARHGGDAGSGIPSRPEQIAVAPIEFTIPKPDIRELSNGIKVYLLEDHELPLIGLSASFPTGSLGLPREKCGLDDILSSAWRQGGTKKLPGEQFDIAVDDLAASVDANMGRETSVLTASGLSRDRARILELAFDLLTDPAIPQDKVELAKLQRLESIRRQNDNPAQLTRRAYRRVFFGTDHPLSWEPTVETVASITRDDVVAAWRVIPGPKDVRIGVTGDFDTATIMAELEATFGKLTADSQVPTVMPSTPPPPTPGLYILPREMSQAQLRFGHQGLPIHHPDYFPVQVYNEVFGSGGFTSRLMSDIRSTKGLTYGIYGGLSLDQFGGQYNISSSTRTDTARELSDAAIFQLERMRREPITEDELTRAKESLINSYVFRFDSPGQIVSTRMDYDRLGYPPDWFDKYVDGIRAVTVEDVLRVAREHTDPLKLAILAVGPEAKMVEEFRGLREPKIISLD